MNLRSFKYFLPISVCLFLCSCTILGSDSNDKNNESIKMVKLENRVTPNSYVKGKIAICGTVKSTAPCLYYVLNGTLYDRPVEDFFDEVSEKTKRSKYRIAIENAMYSKHVIAPGRFAEIVVPALE